MAVAFFLPVVRRRWWPLLLAYPLAMTFTLVYSGEHYVIDVLVGWAYVGLSFLVVGLGERWWRSRGAPPAGSGALDEPPAAGVTVDVDGTLVPPAGIDGPDGPPAGQPTWVG
jgi:hypothetical protein